MHIDSIFFHPKIISPYLLHLADCAVVEWKWYLFTFRCPKKYIHCACYSIIFATNTLPLQQTACLQKWKKSLMYFPNICGFFKWCVRLRMINLCFSPTPPQPPSYKRKLNLMYFNVQYSHISSILNAKQQQSKKWSCKILVSNHNILEWYRLVLWCLCSVYFHEFLFHSVYSQLPWSCLCIAEKVSHMVRWITVFVCCLLCTIIILNTISTWPFLLLSIHLFYAYVVRIAGLFHFSRKPLTTLIIGMLVVLHIHHILAISYQRTFLSFRLFHSLMIIEASYFWLLSVSRNNIFNSYIISFGMYESCTAIHKPFALCMNLALICVLGICFPTLPKNMFRLLLLMVLCWSVWELFCSHFHSQLISSNVKSKCAL